MDKTATPGRFRNVELTGNESINQINVGDTFNIPLDSSVLIGRGGEKVSDRNVIEVVGLKDSGGISRYALEIASKNVGNGSSEMTISIPSGLIVDGETYVPTNDVVIYPTIGGGIEVNSSYIVSQGGDVAKIMVVDTSTKVGFMLEAVGSNQFKLADILKQDSG